MNTFKHTHTHTHTCIFYVTKIAFHNLEGLARNI